MRRSRRPSAREWKRWIEAYLGNRPTLRLAVLLQDLRRDPSEDETLLLRLARRARRARARRADQVRQAEADAPRRARARARASLPSCRPQRRSLATSAETGLGIPELWAIDGGRMALNRAARPVSICTSGMRAIDARWCSDTGRCRGSPCSAPSSSFGPVCSLSRFRVPVFALSYGSCASGGARRHGAQLDPRADRRARLRKRGASQSCHAVLNLLRAAPPSRNLVPRPSELARELAKVMEVLRVATCSVEVWWADDGEPEERECLAAEFRFSGGSWSTVEDDRPC